MNEITNKAIVIAVGVFVTIAITSGILLSINQMKDIYEKVYETDISIKNDFSEFDQYDNTNKKGIDIANALNKYTMGEYASYVTILVSDSSVEVNNNNTTIFWLDETKIENNDDIYSYNYNATLNIANDGRVTITFSRI